MSVWKMPKPDNPKKPWAYKVYYTDWTGRRRQKKGTSFKTRKEAAEAEEKFVNSQLRDSRISFENLVDKYMADCSARLKETTLSVKWYMIREKILPYFGKLPISEVTVAVVRQWQNELLTSEQQYSQTYLKAVHNQLSAIMNYAVRYYGLSKNPAAQCGSIGRKKADDMEFWTVTEFHRFIQAAEEDITAKTVFNLLFFSGMREGEMLALTVDDFDFDHNIVSINKTYARIRSKDIIQPPKTIKSKREVTVPSKVMEMVRSYLHNGSDSSQRVFLLSKKQLYAYMNKYCKLSGIKKIRIHDIRHSHASLLIEKGVSPLAISERLGHEDVQTTLSTYSHLYPDKQTEIADLLSPLVLI